MVDEGVGIPISRQPSGHDDPSTTVVEAEAPAEMAAVRPAFYALRRGGWRDYITLLHPPYTLWNLSYVCLGAGLAQRLDVVHLMGVLLAFALGVGIAAHALDELAGRPLGTTIPSFLLVTLAVLALAGDLALAIAAAAQISVWFVPVGVAGVAFVVGYNLNLFAGVLHNDIGFALAWGAYPVLVGYLAMSRQVAVAPILLALAATALSLAQRALSAQVRQLRRHTRRVTGFLEADDGGLTQLTVRMLIAAPEVALGLMTAAIVLLGASAVTAHFWS